MLSVLIHRLHYWKSSFLNVARLAGVCLLFSFLKPTVYAAESGKANVYAPEIEGSLSLNGSGFYNDFWRLLMSGEEGYIYTMVPHIRAQHRFANDLGSCQFPAMVESHEKMKLERIQFSTPFSRLIVRVFSRQGDEPAKNLIDISRESVVLPSEYKAVDILADAEKLFVSSVYGRAQLLLSGRVNYMVSSMPPTRLLQQKEGWPELSYSKHFALNEFDLALLCHVSEVTEKLLERFNLNLRAKYLSREIEVLYERHGLEFDLYLPRNRQAYSSLPG